MSVVVKKVGKLKSKDNKNIVKKKHKGHKGNINQPLLLKNKNH